MKKVLGLDLGTNSIGWALVNEAETQEEVSSIVRTGVRISPLSVEELKTFETNNGKTLNAERTLKRGARRNLQRYRLRRDGLANLLKEHSFITAESILSEHGNKTTFETYRLRGRAAKEEISLEELARVLLMINKKRGYKSSRKLESNEDGQLIDGMDIAKQLYHEDLTPGQLTLQLLEKGKKEPKFYRSDLQKEFDKIWEKQKEFYPQLLTDELKDELQGKESKAVWAICAKHFVWTETHTIWSDEEAKHIQVEREHKLVGTKRQGKILDQKKENAVWRTKGISEKLALEELVVCLQEINAKLNKSSDYLGKISDRSKELYFNKQTVGEYLMAQLDEDPNVSLKNQVFYRQDYLDEFDAIWNKQAEYHKELTEELKDEIRDIVIFYQRRLKSKKGQISLCEFENRQIEIEVDGVKKMKTIGQRVIPRSSPLFQEFKVWQTLNNIEVSTKGARRKREPNLDLEQMEILAAELRVREKLTKNEVLKLLFKDYKELDLNYEKIEGNLTQAALMGAYKQIIEQSGHTIDYSKKSARETVDSIEEIFRSLGINTDILHFDSNKGLDEQPMYRLWHLLYSFEGDNSKLGNEKLISKLGELYGFEEEYAKILVAVVFKDDYGSLSARAIRRILPYMKMGQTYDKACESANYRHSKSSLTKEEIERKVLKDRLELLPRNSLRNPIVEKILNQMINVVNMIIETYGRPDEIRVELARELKKSAKERADQTSAIGKATRENQAIVELLRKEFDLKHVSRNDIIRYKLYKELEPNGYKTLYSNVKIPQEKLFSKEFDVEHIIPQAKLFDDSFSNKTLELRSINIEKSNATAYDFVEAKYGKDGLEEYLRRIDALFKGTNETKLKKLKTTEEKIPEGFVERDLKNTQYIAKKALEILGEVARTVTPTIGLITDRLRNDWQLVDVMKELNWDKYDKAGLTEVIENRDEHKIKRIKDWTKRNDHRHHAMDALTVAFTKRSIVQFLNSMNALDADAPGGSASVRGIAKKELYQEDKKNRSKFRPPFDMDEFRREAKRHLENTLISIKSNNKVVTRNTNTTKRGGRTNKVVQLTPRGQLHKETVYGSRKQYVVKDEKVGTTFDKDKILMVNKPAYRDALLKRLNEHGGDPKKAFGGKNAPAKNPIFIDEANTEMLPERIKTVRLETSYTIRKEVSPDLNVEKVVDPKIREILQARLNEFGGNATHAFSNLDENPIWQNKEKGISIKRVTISGINNSQALHSKRDKDGKLILDQDGNEQAVDFVSTGNNHHVAIYRDAKGNLQEDVVSFFEAVARVNAGLPVIDREYKRSEGWQFLFTIKQNDYFLLPNEEMGFDPNEYDLLDMPVEAYHQISPHLFRVQKIAEKDYFFRHHLETNVNKIAALRGITWRRIVAPKGLEGFVKLRVNHVGRIVSVGEE